MGFISINPLECTTCIERWLERYSLVEEHPIYSVVVPVYNSERTLDELYDRISRVFEGITKNFEIVLVNDCSVDNSWEMMKALRSRDKRVKIINLLRNFGQHNAVICGFYYSSGDYVITMDDDLQNPPEEIPKLITRAQEGYMVVIGKYVHKEHNVVRNLMSKIFMNLTKSILKLPRHLYTSSFALYRADVAKNMASIKSSYTFLPALMIKSAPVSKITNVTVIHHERKVGRSNYNLLKMTKLSLNLFINYSSLPLTIVGVLGIIISIASIAFGGYIILERAINPNYGLIGWNSLIVAITLLDGAILMSIGIIGEYLRRILSEISYGKQFTVSEMEII